jgi:PAS domain S-box-containing protein
MSSPSGAASSANEGHADLSDTRVSGSDAQALVERAAIGIFRVARDGPILDVNPALVRMLGYPNDESLRAVDLLRDVLWDDDERRRWSQDLDLDRLAEWKEVSWRRFDGSLARVRVSARTVPDAHGVPTLCEGIVEDVSQRVRLDEIARRGERMTSLGRTLAGVAHEINNPLAAIIGFTQILLKDAKAQNDRQALETVLGEAQRAARIVKDLLATARRQESSRQDRVNLTEIVSYILDAERYAIETRGIQVELVVHPSPVTVRGDPAQLEQVLLNLLINARQALEMRSDRARRNPAAATPGWVPSITIRTLVRGDLACVEIADNGEGIAAADLPHIWDPFWTNRDEGEGSGLGLAVVHGIITSHNGAIEAQSDKRAGTVFSITLPLDTTASGSAHAVELTLAASPPSAGGPRPLDILVIDDEASLRNLFQRIFSKRGHAVVTAVDGAQALRLAARSTFDVVVCDLRMPGMDGRDVITRLSQLDSCTKTRFVLATGDAATTHGELLGGETRVDAIVSKPFSVDALIGAVEARATQ